MKNGFQDGANDEGEPTECYPDAYPKILQRGICKEIRVYALPDLLRWNLDNDILAASCFV